MAGIISIPPKSALLIIDWQRFFVDPSSRAFVRSCEKAAPPIERIISLFLMSGMPVLASVHIGKDDSSDPFFRFYGKSAGRDEALSGLAAPIAGLPGISVFVKSTYSVFESRDFMERVSTLKVRRFYIAGLQADKCVLANAFAAFDKGYRVSVLEDCVAARDLRRRSAALSIIARSCGEVVSSGTLGDGSR